MLPRVGWLLPFAKSSQAREVLLAQQSQYAIDVAVVITLSDRQPTPVQVIKKQLSLIQSIIISICNTIVRSTYQMKRVW